MKKFNIELDFDATMVYFRYPDIGVEVYNAVPVVKRLQQAGHTVYLNTRRADLDQDTFRAAKQWMRDHGISCEARPSKRQPAPFREGMKLCTYNSPEGEPYIFIDDECKGIPMLSSVVDWIEVENILEANNFFTSKTED